LIKKSAQLVAKLAAQAADDKKADDIQVLKMPEIMVETEFFVICSASTLVQVHAIVNSITSALEDEGIELLRYEGRKDNNWVLLDYGFVVVHVFLEEDRHYYDLEKLWSDAKRIPWS